MKSKSVRMTWLAVLALGLVFAGGTALAQGPEDIGGSGPGAAPAGPVTEIPAMTIPNVVLDFDALPAGPTTAGAIDAAFPGSACANFTFVTRAATGGYNFQTGGGRALAPNPDLSGNLFLVDPPAGTFGEADSLTIDLSEPTTEFGFEIGDWAGPFNANVYDGGGLVGTVQVSTAGDIREHFLQSTVPFDSVELTALPDNPPANWVVPTLTCPEGTSMPTQGIPTLDVVGLAVLATLLLVAAFFLLRRRARA